MADKKQKIVKDGKEKKAVKEKKTKKSDYKFPVVSDPYQVIKFVLMTEKSLQNVELENKLIFIVDNKANKNTVKDAIESAFKKRIKDVNILIDQKSRKKAIVRFVEDGAAGDIAMKLGML